MIWILYSKRRLLFQQSDYADIYQLGVLKQPRRLLSASLQYADPHMSSESTHIRSLLPKRSLSQMNVSQRSTSTSCSSTDIEIDHGLCLHNPHFLDASIIL